MNGRLRIAIGLNIILPGSGLILTQREWLGFVLAVVFTAGAQVTLFGSWIAPEEVASWLTATGAGAAAAVWVTGQCLLRNSIRTRTGQARDDQLSTCFALADAAMKLGRYDEACRAIDVAITVDDENPETYARLARLSTLIGEYDRARKAWRRVEKLDRRRIFHGEMADALARLPYRAGE